MDFDITRDSEKVSSVIGPVTVVALTSYLTASVMLGIYDTSVITMMTCLSIDMDQNDGVPKKGPKTFHDCMKVEKLKLS